MKNIKTLFALLFIISTSNNMFSQFTSATDVYTPNNTRVSDVKRFTGSDFSYSATQIQTLKDDLWDNYGHAELYALPTNKHNCHSFAWHVVGGGVPRWVGYYTYTAENVYWTDNSYLLTNTVTTSGEYSFPSTPHLRVSYPENGNGNHSAVTTRQNGWFVSKWGNGPTVKHRWNECPYTDRSVLKFYRRATDGWTKQWSNYVTNKIDGHTVSSTDKFYAGDFDGDGEEELLCVQTDDQNNDDWMTMLHYDNNDWQWGWSNYGNPSTGGGIYPYRHNLLVGDFDGDGKDEVLGNDTPNGWITMFHFDNGNWHWGWSNYGSTTAGRYIYNFRNNLTTGDYDGDNKDEILGVSSYGMRIFDYTGGDFTQLWYQGTSHSMWPYRDDLNAGDFDGDGKDEILGNDVDGGGWITMFHYDNGNFNWGWSDYGTDNGMRPYRQDFLVGDFDKDNKDEILGFDPPNGWVTMFNYNSGSWHWGFSTYSNKRLNDWWFKDYSNDKVLSIDANGTNQDYLMLFRKHDLYVVNMYSYTGSLKSATKENNELSDSGNDSDIELKSSSDLQVFPNPAMNNFTVNLEGSDNYIIDVINMNGQVVEHINTSESLVNINCSEYPKGVYIIKVISSGNIQQQKIIIGQ